MKTFKDLFAGRTDAFGQYERPAPQLGGEKRLAKRWTETHKELTDAHWDAHLNGEVGLGIVPVLQDDTVWWGAIDVDKYESMGQIGIKIEARVSKLGLPLCITRTKSGGAHCWVFFSEPAPAYEVIETLKKWTKLIGFQPGQKVDIFPSQESVKNLDAGGWVNLPYFDADVGTDRIGFGPKGKTLTLKEFVSHANTRMIHPADLNRADEHVDTIQVAGNDVPVDHADAPPCIQALMANGVPDGDGRNNALRHMGVYFQRAFPDDWEDRMGEANEEFMQPPLPFKEVGPMIRNLRNAGATKSRYFCDKAPMVNCCDAQTCRLRKFGVGEGGGSISFEITSITKYPLDVPFYICVVNDQEVRCTYDTLISAQLFSKACGQALDQYPMIPKKFDWKGYINDLMKDRSKMKVDQSYEELSSNSRVQNIFNDWVSAQAINDKDYRRIMESAPVYLPDDKCLIFRATDMMKVLGRNNMLLKPQELVPVLSKELQATEATYDVDGQTVKVFQIQYKSEPWFAKDKEEASGEQF